MSDKKMSKDTAPEANAGTIAERSISKPSLIVVFIAASLSIWTMFAIGMEPLGVAVTIGSVAFITFLVFGIYRFVNWVLRDYGKKVDEQEKAKAEQDKTKDSKDKNSNTKTTADANSASESFVVERVNPEDIDVDFSSVAGNDAAKRDLYETVDFLKDPDKYTSRGARIPKGVLLHGVPGIGKTLLAKAVAKESGVPFFPVSGSDFVNKFVGVGAKNVRTLFDAAGEAADEAEYSAAIIFIDEIDNLGRTRNGSGGGSQEYDHALGQLLTEMDGFKHLTRNIIVIGATNRMDIIDSALLRPGRMDRIIAVERPDFTAREAILKVHSRDKMIDPSVDLNTLAKRTPGFTGADLANLINEALILSVRKDKESAGFEEFAEAIDIVVAGHERETLILTDEEKKLIAWHELGHALVGELLEHGDPVQKVTSIPRGKSLGHTQAVPERDKHLHRKEELMARIAVCMGGRVAEELKFDGIKTSGAGNDLEKAREIAESMVRDLAMTDDLGPNVYPAKSSYPGLDYDPDTSRRVEEQVNKLMVEGHRTAQKLLSDNWDLLSTCAERLIEIETIERKEFIQLIESHSKSAEAPATAS